MPLKFMLTTGRFAGFALSLLLQGCGPSVEGQTQEHPTTLAAPSQDVFPDVDSALQLSCGTLDCHGQVGRNLRLYGYGGLRLSATESPIGAPTTDQEVTASYESVVALEPETLASVVTLQADPDELTLVRKMRGIELHKGGQRVQQGDALDRCVVLWLTGKPEPDPDPCTDIVNNFPPATP
jgi:hypothetical protein